MIVIRPVTIDDFGAYVKLAFASHINFTTLPKNERLLEMRFTKALSSFLDASLVLDHQSYLFVAEDTGTKKLLGIAAISSTSGGNEPLFFFRKEYIHNKSQLVPVVKKLAVLNPISYLHGPSEVGSLFVDPSSRGTGIGKLLSLSRFLFIAAFPDKFTGSFISELRGPVVDGVSIFWEAIGRRFFDVSFDEVQEMMSYSRNFIHDFLPQYPIYIDLLPKDVQNAIGMVDQETQGAFSLLQRLGFKITDEVDVIDGGPKVMAKKEDLIPINASRMMQVSKINDACELDKQEYIIANERFCFRAVLAPIILLDESNITINSETSLHLKIGLGDYVRIFDPKSI